MSDSRTRRPAKPASKAKTSLAQLAELRRTGAKRVHNFELKEEDAVYDEVQEQDYAKLVQDRREEAGQMPSKRNSSEALQATYQDYSRLQVTS